MSNKIVIDISSDGQYHTQLNNKFFPTGTCNTTSAINALFASKIDFSYPEDLQPEDYLTRILDSDEAWEKMRREHSWAIRDGFAPRHVHRMLEWAINEKLVDKRVDLFLESLPFQSIIFHVAVRRQAVVLSGAFTAYGHIVTLVGLETEQSDIEQVQDPAEINLDAIDSLIVDDPYGDWHTQYRDQHGNGVKFSFQQLNNLTTTRDNAQHKRVHLFNRDGWNEKNIEQYL